MFPSKKTKSNKTRKKTFKESNTENCCGAQPHIDSVEQHQASKKKT